MDRNVREMYFNCEICAGRSIKPKRGWHINKLIVIMQKKDIK